MQKILIVEDDPDIAAIEREFSREELYEKIWGAGGHGGQRRGETGICWPQMMK